MPESEYETLEKLYLYYKGRYEKGNQVRMQLSEQKLQILEEIELRYRLLSLLYHFGNNLLENPNIEKKLYCKILKELLNMGMPEDAKQAPKNISSFPELIQSLNYLKSSASNFHNDFKQENTDQVILCMDMMDIGEAILRYAFIFREIYHVSVLKGKKVVAGSNLT